MKITYLLDQPQLCGGVKVVFQHAALLRALGHAVTIVANGPPPDWIGFSGTYCDSGGGAPRIPPQDLVVATYWTTVAVALALAAGPVVHFCQGYEADCPHLAAQAPAIEAAYRRRIPAWVVAPHLGQRIAERFKKASMLVPPPVDPLFRPRWRLGPHRPARVLVHGIFEANWKGVAAALAAIGRLREAGLHCQVIRVSTFPLTAAERALCEPDRYLLRAPPGVVARVTRGCDLLLFAPTQVEGFGLPALEALASGVPLVATRIPSLAYLTGGEGRLVPPGDDASLAAEAERLLRDGAAWRRARAAGRAQARRFFARRVAADLVRAIDWARGEGQNAPP